MTAPTNDARDVAERWTYDDAAHAIRVLREWEEAGLSGAHPRVYGAAADLIEQMAARIAELEASIGDLDGFLDFINARSEGRRIEGWITETDRDPAWDTDYYEVATRQERPGDFPAILILRRPSSDSSSTEHNPAADPSRAEESET